MATLARLPLFLRCDSPDKVSDIVNGASKVPRGCDVQVNLGMFYKNLPHDLANFSSIHFEIAVGNKPTSARIVNKVIAATDPEFVKTLVDATAWKNQADANITFTLTGDEMNQDLGNSDSKNYFVIISGITTTGTRWAFGKGTFTIFEDGTSDNANPPPEVSAPTYLTAAQVQAIIASLPSGGGGSGLAVDFTITQLVGGAAGCLDNVATAGLPTPQAKFFITASGFQVGVLEIDPNSPADGKFVVQPVDYHPVNNQRKWKIVL